MRWPKFVLKVLALAGEIWLVTGLAHAGGRWLLTQESTDSGGAPPAEQDVRELEPGKPIERELAGGEVHAYRITLASGQYMRVVVNQRGIDVVVKLFGPDGQQLVEVNKTDATQGLEPVSLWAETPGDYRLEVRARQQKAAAGRYEAKIEELRMATVQDQSRVAAEQAFMEAEQLRAQGTAESLPQAMEKYEEALALWQAVEDQWEVAATLNSIGLVHHLLGENRKALDSYQQALALFQAVGDRVGEANALYGIGNAHFWLDEYQKALDYSTQALQVYQPVSDRRGEAAALNRIGTSHHATFEYEKAFKCYLQAIPLWRLVGDRTGEAGTLDNLAGFYCMIDQRQALDYYQQALSIHRELNNRRGEAELLTGMGNLYIGLDEPKKALECVNAALPLRRAVGDRLGEAYTLGVLGALYKFLGDPRKAIETWNQQLQITRELGRSEAGIFVNIGGAYHELEKNDTALKYLNQSLLMLRDDSGYKAAALYHFAQVLRDLGNLTEARAKVEAGLKILESKRTRIVNPDWRGPFTGVSSFYELYIDLLMRQHQSQPSAGHDAAALHASERARARSLLDLLTEARADIRQGVDPVLLERERTLQQQLNAKEQSRIQLLSGKHTKEQAAAAEKELRELLAQRDEVQAQIRATSPHYAALTQPQPLSLKEIQQQVLDEDTLLLEYSLGEERSFFWAVTPASIASFELPKRTEIEQAAKHVYQLLTAPNENVKGETDIQKMARIARAEAEYPNAAAALSQMLLGPVADQLGNKRLLIVSDGALQYIPFAALPKPVNSGQWTVDSGQQEKSRNERPQLFTVH